MDEQPATTIDEAVDTPPMSPLKALRKAHRMSQAALACAAPCSPNIIIYTELYGYCPTPEIQHRIAVVFGVRRTDIWPEKQR